MRGIQGKTPVTVDILWEQRQEHTHGQGTEREREGAAMNAPQCSWASPFQHSPQKCAHLPGGISISPGPGWLWLGPEMQRRWPGTTAAWTERQERQGWGQGWARTQRQERWGKSGAKRRRQNHTQKQRHRWTRDRADLREVTAAPGRTINSGGPRKKTNGSPWSTSFLPPFLLSILHCEEPRARK